MTCTEQTEVTDAPAGEGLTWWEGHAVPAFKVHALPLLLLIALMIAVYGDVPTHEFLGTWDDPGYITKNPAVQGFSWQHLKMAFTLFFVGNYAPVQIVSYMLDHALWGMNPAGFFLANLLYHFLSGLLLYFLLLRQKFPKWGAVLGAAVFLVHPVQMESVAWASQRKNLLAMLWFLVAFHAWLSYRERTGAAARKWYVFSVVAFILALLSKSVAVIFPLMLLAYDSLVPPVRRRLLDHADKIPHLLAAGVVGILTIVIQAPGVVGGRTAYPEHALVVLPLTMLPVLTGYLRLLLWPDPSVLCIVYPVPMKYGMDGTVFCGLAVAGCLAALGVYLHRKKGPAFFWYGLFFLGLLPVAQIIPMVTKMNDRYLYFPMLGIAGLTACVYGRGIERFRSRLSRRTGAAGAVALVVLLAAASQIRSRDWKNTLTLFGDATTKAPGQVLTWYGLADGYMAAGDPETAVRYYDKASSFGYVSAETPYNLAHIFLEKGDFEKAYTYIWAYRELSGKSKEGSLLLGEYYGATGDYVEAEKELLTYLAEVPDSARGLFTLGKVYFMREDYARARDLYARAKGAGDDSTELYIALTCLESRDGHPAQSLAYLQEALQRGFTNRELLMEHPYLAALRRDPRFLPLVRRYLGAPVQVKH